ncbi:gamma-aminobutyric acid receptor subunit rho-1-like [Clytia hemisphaerica]|uniref:Neurotransmitter-gated ion-channel ligand-binding domain-containing protein n=1 Tax=Clytia hemisphaerica TaxID=252671 RepID=A0A7M5WX77_9CNID
MELAGLKIVLSLLTAFWIQPCYGVNIASLENINMTEYEKVTLPYLHDNNKTVEVNVSMYILNIGNMNTREMTFEVEMYFSMNWTDPRLAFEEYHNASYALVTGEIAYENIWVPDLFIRNMKFVESSKFLKDLSGVMIYPDGVITLSSRLRVVAHCEMDLLMFPLDSQSCNLMIESYLYHTDVMKTYWAEDPIVVDKRRDGRKTEIDTWMGFTLEETKTAYNRYIYPLNGLEFHYMIATFVLKREPQYYILRGFIPSSLLVCLTWASFWIPTTSYPARIGIVVTSFLASIVLYTGSTLDSHQMTVMQMFLFGNIAFIGLTLIEFLMAIRSDKKRKMKQKVIIAIDLIKEDNQTIEKADSKTSDVGKEKENLVDKRARYIIPFVYLLYLAIFVAVIMFH